MAGFTSTLPALILNTLFVLCLFAAPAKAEDDEKENVLLKVAGNTLVVADCAQTYQAMKDPDKYSEKNPLLGSSPSPGRVLATCAGVLIGLNVADHFMPKTPSNVMWGIVIAAESHAVWNNIQAKREVDRMSLVDYGIPDESAGTAMMLSVTFRF